MKVNLLKDEFKSLEKFYKLLTPRIHNNKRAFEQILYPEKRSPPLSSEILMLIQLKRILKIN